MPILKVDGQQIFFAHIPKRGGTSIEDGLSPLGTLSLLDRRFFREKRRILPCSPQHFHAAAVHKLFPRNYFDFSFGVVRDPMSRLLSEFKFRSRAKPRFRRRTRPRGIGPEPSEFNQWVADAFQNFLKHPFIYDNHIRPQTEFLLETTEVFKLEDGLVPVFERLSEVLATPVSAPTKRALVSPKQEISVSPETQELVREFYKRDFEELGYAHP